MGNEEKKGVCIPIKERELNEVDKLTAQILRIQEACDHDFRLAKEPKLHESLVKGVFVGHLEQGTLQVQRSELEMVLVCLRCSEEKVASIIKTCPQCLCPMKEEWCQGAESREKYFGEEYLYYSATLSRCPNCGFTVASDEWDQ